MQLFEGTGLIERGFWVRQTDILFLTCIETLRKLPKVTKAPRTSLSNGGVLTFVLQVIVED